MKKLTIATIALFAFCGTAAAQPPQDMLLGRVQAVENRVTVTEQRLDRLAEWIDRHDPDSRGAAAPAGGKQSYAEAYARALTTGRPLLIWNGAAICPACVHDSADEFVSFVGSVEGCPTNAVTVAVPEGGELRGVGVVDQWVTSHPVLGHLPSVRRILQRWRDRRQTTADTASQAYQMAAMMGYGQPVMMMGGMGSGMGNGGCASCGSSGGRGLFGRR